MTTSTTSRALPWALIGAACLGSFAATSSGTTRAPFLLDMSHDLGVSMPLVANLVSMTATAWGFTSAFGGWISDRIGRRVLLVGGLFALALAMCGQRGRALGWVMTGQSLTLVVGVPLAAWIGSAIGWRGWNVCVGGLALAGAIGLFITAGRRISTVGSTARRPSMRAALSPNVLGLLGIGISERICYGLATIYFATFLQAIYGLSLGATALPLFVFALGNIAGTVLGGQVADRFRDRMLTFAGAMALSGMAALGLFMWHPAPAVSVALGFGYTFMNALGRPSYMAALASVPDNVRGTVLGLNGTSASVGWVGAAALGALIISTVGFEGFGPLAALLGLSGALGALANRRLKISI
jgi:MFS transporter, DHA1 family, inner membrane transport protein